jgi:amino acid transporter
MCFKFIPLVFAIVIGYIVFGMSSGCLPDGTKYLPSSNHNPAPFLTDYSPVLGIIASVPAIFFAFNGFQYPASMTSHMKNPKQLPLSMLVGIVIVIIVYVLISLSLILSSGNGGVDGLHG